MAEKLQKYCTVISGYAFKSKDLSEGTDIPVIKIGNISNGENVAIDDSTQYVNEEFLSIDEKYHIKNGDILISLTGSHMNQPNSMVGRCCRNLDDTIYLLNQRAGKIIPKKSVDKDFLYYVFRLPSIQYAIANRAYGGANQVNVSPKDVMGIKFDIPDITIQRKIANALIAYDTLIQNNNKRIRLLEQMAENLYKEWFVRFRFPGYEDVEFENRIPKGWEYYKLINFIDVRYGKDHKNIEEGAIPILGSGGIMRFGDRALYNGEAVLIPRKGSLNNIMYINGEFWTVDTLFYSIPKIKNIARYLYFTFKYIDMGSLNSGASIPSMTTDIIYHLKMRQPDAAVLEKFDEVLKPIYEEIDLLGKRNDNIKKQRDMLLPRLMSGKLEV